MKNILVSGIGGNVGQGVLMNINSMNSPIKVIGMDICQYTAGNHLCSKVYSVPYAYDGKYIPKVIDVCEKERIDLIIPTTDYEVCYLSQFQSQIPSKVLGNPFETAKVFLDKYRTWRIFESYNIPFAQSWTVEDYKSDNLTKIIAKPRKGRGSRGIILNPTNIQELGEDYMIQNYIEGIELTSAIYVTKDKKLIGPLTFERELEAGATQKCWVSCEFDDQILSIATKINNALELVGPINIQSRVNGDGKVIPFEINGRYSGTNSIRGKLGFNDVEMGINEHLFEIPPLAPKKIRKGVAVRLIKDVIYPEISNIEEISSKSDIFYLN